MEYKVLYRKYRPENFENIVDQDVIIRTLKNSIKNNKISHAYLFSGPRGTGKTSTAKVFAKALNCDNYNDGPCNKCQSCLNASHNPDIIEIDAASNNGVDDIRELINNVKLAPSLSKYKVYIIDEVHMLTTNAFNALLLTLEEPPSNVVFILATTNVESVPITILSRCQRFDFSQISSSALKERLNYVCNEEKIRIDDDALDEICQLSEGGLRDALGILDQLSSQTNNISLEIVQNSYKIVSRKKISDLIKSFTIGDADSLLNILNDIEKNGYEFKNVIKRIIDELYNYIKNNNDNIEQCFKIKNLILELNKIINEVNIYVSPYILLKSIFLVYIKKGDNNHDDVQNKIKLHQEELPPLQKKDKQAIVSENYFPGNNSDIKKIRINNTFVNPKKDYLNNIKSMWKDFLKNEKNENLLSLLVESSVVACSDTNAIISTEVEATSHLINASLKLLDSEFEHLEHMNIKFVAVYNEEWEKLKKDYVKNKAKKYTYIDEISTIDNNDEMSIIANDLFAKEKIEME